MQNNYLLDTHTFLWFINDDVSLTPTAKHFIENPENIIYLSAASVWEMAIKVSLGKLAMPTPFTDFMDDQLRANAISLLDIKTSHTGFVASLPFYHRDPFDRLIIAQSKSEDIPVIGGDVIFDRYEIKRYW